MRTSKPTKAVLPPGEAVPDINHDADAFAARFRQVDHVLKRTEFADRRRKRADVDWERFAESLGEDFFAEVRDSGQASILIAEPPRILMSDTLSFKPENPEPITNVVELFIRGVCQVRHNYFHGEKFVGGSENLPRDRTLVRQALWVLDLAAARHPRLQDTDMENTA